MTFNGANLMNDQQPHQHYGHDRRSRREKRENDADRGFAY